jgi:hypothetical protein
VKGMSAELDQRTSGARDDWATPDKITTVSPGCRYGKHVPYFRGAANQSSRRRSRLSVNLQTLAKVAAPMRRVIRIWYLTASCGSTPDRIWPVIISGKKTTPVAAMELIRIGFATTTVFWPRNISKNPDVRATL